MINIDDDSSKISVIIPVYNTEKFLPFCIESVLNQSYDNWELIMVDDGSNDGSLEVCSKYASKDTRIRFIKQNHMGIGAARVAGIKNTTGAFVAFIDSDDWMDKCAFENLINPLLMDDNLDISICSFVVYNKYGTSKQSDDKSENYIRYESQKAVEMMFANKGYNWSLCGKIYRRKLFSKNEYIYACWPAGYGEDTFVNWRLFNSASNVVYIPRSYYHYRYNPSSTMHQSLTYDKLVYFDIWREILESIDDIYGKIAQNIMDVMFSVGWSVLIEFMECGIYRNDLWYRCRDVLSKYMRFYHKRSDERIKCLYGRLMLSDDELQQKKKVFIDGLKKFRVEHQVVYIFGAGRIAEELANLMVKENIQFQGFLVTDSRGNTNELCGHSVLEFKYVIDMDERKNIGIITAVNCNIYNEIIRNIREAKYDIFNGGVISLRY